MRCGWTAGGFRPGLCPGEGVASGADVQYDRRREEDRRPEHDPDALDCRRENSQSVSLRRCERAVALAVGRGGGCAGAGISQSEKEVISVLNLFFGAPPERASSAQLKQKNTATGKSLYNPDDLRKARLLILHFQHLR